MSDGNPILSMLLRTSQFLGPSEEWEDTMKPLPEQFDLAPGDKCVVATASTTLEEDFTLVEIIPPDSYPATFPDWETRFTLHRHVLCRFFSVDDMEGALGWFARLKLIKITDEEYAEADSWRASGFPERPPEWVGEAYTRYTDALSVRNPAAIPVLVTCPYCEGRNVDLNVTARRKLTGRAGQLQRDDKIVYVPVQDPDGDTTWIGRLTCTDCGASASLEEEEWELPPK